MKCQKKLFSLPAGHHYLNCAYFSPIMKRVEDAGLEGIRQKRTPWKVLPDEFFNNSNKLRSLFARLVGVSVPNRIAILPSVSYGLSTVAKNLPKVKNKKIVIVDEQFPSNVYPWMRYCNEHNCSLEIVKAPEDDTERGREWNRRILEAIDGDTLMVALGNIHWTDGTLFDLTTIGEKARDAGAWFVIDSTQSVGALPFDVNEIQPDALICAGYKWLMGPYSIALGYFGPKLDQGIPLEEGWINRENSEDFAGLVDYAESYQPGAIRYDVGERSNFILVPMMIEALDQLLEWGPAHIQKYCGTITDGIRDELCPRGFRIEEDDWRSKHLFGIRMPEHLDRKELKRILSEHNIHVAVRGSAIRVSPNVYNDRRDIDALVDVLKSVS